MKLRLPRRRLYRVMIYIVSVVLILLAIDLGLVRIGRHLTIGVDTTYITSPLKADGMPDYRKYMESEYSQGVTAENNAAAELVASFNPSILPDNARTVTYAALGRMPPAAGIGLVNYDTFVADKKLSASEVTDQYREVGLTRDRFWSAADKPLLAGYLKSQAGALAAFHRAAQLPRYYCPMVNSNGTDMLISLFVPALHGTDLAAHLTLSQAMLDANGGDFEKAHGEILDVHRMANLLAQQPSMIEVVAAMRLGAEASDADEALAGSGKLTSEAARRYLADLGALVPMPTPEHAIDKGERLFGLDFFVYASRVGMPEALRMVIDPQDSIGTFGYHFVPVNFNELMRLMNRFYDELAAAGREPTYARKISACNEAEKHATMYAKSGSWDPTRTLLGLILPSMVGALKMEVSQRMRLDLARVAYALAAYQAEHHGYPETLAQLEAIMSVIPQDMFVAQSLHYQKTAEGYVLYSVGPNMVDDGGRKRHHGYSVADDLAGYSGADDLVVRVPAEKAE